MNQEVRKLYRSRKERMIGGVCSGLGNFLGIDATVLRLIFIIALFTWPGPVMAAAYLILLVVVPEEPILSSSEPPSSVTIDAP